MTALQSLKYAQDKYRMISDAWSHTVHLLSYPCQYPEEYMPKFTSERFPIEVANAKNFTMEMDELFNEFIKYNFLYTNDKGNLTFKNLTINEGIRIIESE